MEGSATTSSKMGHCRRAICTFATCVVIAVSGSFWAFNSFSENLKNWFGLTETQVSMMASAGTIGASIGYPAGLIIENLGVVKAYMLAAFLGSLASILLFTASLYPSFFQANTWTLCIFWFLYCFGMVIMDVNGLVWNMASVSTRHRGLMVGVSGLSWWLGGSIFSALFNVFTDKTFPYVFIMTMSVVILANVFVIVCLKCFPMIAVVEDDAPPKSTEETPLVDEDNGKWASVSNFMGLHLLKEPVFHILIWAFILGASVQLMYVPTLEAFIMSYRLYDLTYLEGIAPFCAGLSTFASGVLSDVTINLFPRSLYLIIASLIQCLVLIISRFNGDQNNVFIATTIIVYFSSGVYFGVIPALVSDFFGMKHFPRNWGANIFATSLGSLILMFLLGSLYDSEVSSHVDSSSCTGLHCFSDIYAIAAVLSSAATLLFCVLAYKEWSFRKPEWKMM